jgi:hypothetical protein
VADKAAKSLRVGALRRNLLAVSVDQSFTVVSGKSIVHGQCIAGV